LSVRNLESERFQRIKPSLYELPYYVVGENNP